MMLTYVPIPSLSAVWPVVRQHVADANAKLGERNTPEELYYALRQNLAGLYLADAGRGVVILQNITELDGTKTLFVWLCVGPLSEDRAAVQAELEAVARKSGAVRLRMRSPRSGWARATNGYWTAVETLYEHTLGEQHELAPQSDPLAA